MKGHYMMKVLAITAIVGLATAMASGGRDEEQIVEELISKRTDAMSRFYASEIDLKEAETLLKETEKGSLLEKDIENLRSYFRTDIEPVIKYQFTEIEFTEKEEDLLCADVTMDWETGGMEKNEKIRTYYSVICEKEGDSFKLVQFF